MKQFKKDTSFTITRDIVRLFFALLFYICTKTLHIHIELESEYVVLLSVLILGPLFCSWACPFGSASYFMTRIGSLLFPKWQKNIPEKLDKPLRYVRYVLLVYFLSLFVFKGVNYFGDHMDMYFSSAFSTFFIKTKHFFVLAVALFVPQFFCKYLCWQKASYILINKLFKTTAIQRDADVCISCKKCDKVCPMGIDVSTADKVSGGDCLSCFNCLDKGTCPPKAQSLQLTFFGQKVNYVRFAIIGFTVYIILSVLVVHLLGAQ